MVDAAAALLALGSFDAGSPILGDSCAATDGAKASGRDGRAATRDDAGGSEPAASCDAASVLDGGVGFDGLFGTDPRSETAALGSAIDQTMYPKKAPPIRMTTSANAPATISRVRARRWLRSLGPVLREDRSRACGVGRSTVGIGHEEGGTNGLE